MTGPGKAAVAGVLLALVATAAVVAAISFDLIPAGWTSAPPDEVLVIATAPQPTGSEAVHYAVVLAPRKGMRALDVDAASTVAGTSAKSAREAFAFGGGEAVAEALSPQTGGEALSWIVLAPADWQAFIDASGGLEVDVPTAVSTYASGTLTVLEPGSQSLSAEQAVALALSAEYLDSGERERVLGEMRSGFASVLASNTADLTEAAKDGDARSSLTGEQIERFFESW